MKRSFYEYKGHREALLRDAYLKLGGVPWLRGLGLADYTFSFGQVDAGSDHGSAAQRVG